MLVFPFYVGDNFSSPTLPLFERHISATQHIDLPHSDPATIAVIRKLPPPSPGSFPAFSLDANEALKVERKRARNRVAASKCRMRKIEKIQTLDQETSCLKAENDELAGIANKLREQV